MYPVAPATSTHDGASSVLLVVSAPGRTELMRDSSHPGVQSGGPFPGLGRWSSVLRHEVIRLDRRSVPRFPSDAAHPRSEERRVGKEGRERGSEEEDGELTTHNGVAGERGQVDTR